MGWRRKRRDNVGGKKKRDRESREIAQRDKLFLLFSARRKGAWRNGVADRIFVASFREATDTLNCLALAPTGKQRFSHFSLFVYFNIGIEREREERGERREDRERSTGGVRRSQITRLDYSKESGIGELGICEGSAVGLGGGGSKVDQS